jgi:competence protein ComEA
MLLAHASQMLYAPATAPPHIVLPDFTRSFSADKKEQYSKNFLFSVDLKQPTKAIKNYLSVTKKEWNGMVVLLILILLILVAPYIYQYFHKETPTDFKEFDKAVALLNSGNGNSLSEDKIANPVLFKFDPNNLPAEKWQQLGLSERQIAIIKNYEAKGGRFYKKQDVQKIYAISAVDYKRLAPYIDIPEGYTNKPNIIIELNSADSVKLTRINGIGPSFAQRIIEYRNRLGGFLTKEQLKEIYGLDEEKYSQIKDQVNINPARITKIKINQVDFEGLRRFPYLTNKQTNAIIQYRNQHGNYNSIADMRNIVILNDDILRKIEPYLVF